MQWRLSGYVLATLLACTLRVHADTLDTAPLVRIAARYNLPCPPKEARLVLAYAESTQMLGNQSTSRDPKIYSPAFLLEEETNGDIVVQRGVGRQILTAEPNTPLWRPFSTNYIPAEIGRVCR